MFGLSLVSLVILSSLLISFYRFAIKKENSKRISIVGFWLDF